MANKKNEEVVVETPAVDTPVVNTETSEKKYSESEVQFYVMEAIKNLGLNVPENKKSAFSEEDKKKLIKVNRFNGEWVVDYVDHNVDPYNKKQVFVFESKNVYTGKLEPHIELQYADGTKEVVAYQAYFRNRSRDTDFEVLSEKKTKIVINQGTTERVEWDGKWNMQNTGETVELEVLRYETKYEVEIDGFGKVLLPDYVIG